MNDISTRIKQLMQHLNLRQADVAEALGISLDRVKSLTSGRVHQLKMKEVHAMVEKFHLNPLWLTSGEGPMLEDDAAHPEETSTPDVEYVYVPRHAVQTSAGSGAVVNDESIVDSLAFKRDWIVRALGLDPARLALIDVAGDSMTPTISNGDLILLDTRPMTHRAEGIYVISHDNALLVKRLRVRLNGDVEIISDNPRYGSETITGEQLTRLRIVGRVVWQGRRV